MGLALEGEPDTQAIATRCHRLLVELQKEVSTKACRLTPSLIDAMNGVVAVDGLSIQKNLSLAFIAVMVDDDVDGLVLFGCDTHQGGMTGGGEFCDEMLVGQSNCIIMRM